MPADRSHFYSGSPLRIVLAALVLLAGAALAVAGRPYDSEIELLVILAVGASFALAGFVGGTWKTAFLAPIWMVAAVVASDLTLTTDTGPTDLDSWSAYFLGTLAFAMLIGVGVMLNRLSTGLPALDLAASGRRGFLIGAATVVLSASLATGIFLEGRGTINLVKESDIREASIEGLTRVPTSKDDRVDLLAQTDGYCVGNQRKPEVEDIQVRSTKETIAISVSVQEFEEPHDICAGIGYSAPVSVDLREPLGERPIVDANRNSWVIWPTEGQLSCSLDRYPHRDHPNLRELVAASDRDDLSRESLFRMREVHRVVGTACDGA